VADNKGGAIVFLDELDSVLKSQTDVSRAHEEDRKVVNEFLNHLETSDDHIVFIGATNRFDVLDQAGIRSGRIDKTVHIGKPTLKDRKEILATQLDHRPNTVTEEQIEFIAERTSGLVAADLAALVEDAARRTVFERGDDTILWEDLRQVTEEYNK